MFYLFYLTIAIPRAEHRVNMDNNWKSVKEVLELWTDNGHLYYKFNSSAFW